LTELDTDDGEVQVEEEVTGEEEKRKRAMRRREMRWREMWKMRWFQTMTWGIV
jgi:hypothetical protein